MNTEMTDELGRILIEVKEELEATEFFKEHQTLAGLCDAQVTVFKKYLTESKFFTNKDAVVSSRHGEIKHSVRYPSRLWPIQHTWIALDVDGDRFYLDATASQFRRFDLGIPDTWISTKSPKWFVSDRDNVFVKAMRLDNKVFPGKNYNGPIAKLADKLVYDVQGKVYDFIGKLLKLQ